MERSLREIDHHRHPPHPLHHHRYDHHDIESQYGHNNNNNIVRQESHNQNHATRKWPCMKIPDMNSDPQWAFIRKVYAIISMQLLLTAAVAATVVFYRPIPHFFAKTTPGLVAYIFIVIVTLILMLPLYVYRQSHPVNFVLLGLFTTGNAFSVGLACAYTKGTVILEAAILCSIMVVSLTLYTFWAVIRGSDFSFLGPFLFASLWVLIAFALIQIIFPLGKLTLMIYSALASIIFCGYIIYDTYNLIEKFSYDEYIWASVGLYLDIINLFIDLLNLLGASSDGCGDCDFG